MTLGRAAVADVQLVDEAVSRFHALIELQPDGRHAIADLDSKAGVAVDGTAVRRHVLEAGAVVEICGFQLRYEWVDDDAPLQQVPKVNGYIAVRQTSRSPQARSAASPASPPTAFTGQGRVIVDEARPLEAGASSYSLPARVDVPIAATESVEAQLPVDTAAPVDAAAPVDTAAPVDSAAAPVWLHLLRDVLALQDLRLGGPSDPARAAALEALFTEPRISSDQASRRASRRHPCRAPVLVGTRRGPEVVTMIGHMLDASAEGARLCTDERLTVGSSCWILVPTGDGERSGIAFSARVIWSHPDTRHCGVVFVGRPVVGPDVLPPMRRG